MCNLNASSCNFVSSVYCQKKYIVACVLVWKFYFSSVVDTCSVYSCSYYILSHLPRLVADTFIQKTRKLYLDTRTQRNLSKLNDDLVEVQQIMTRNIQEVLGVGDRLDRTCIFMSSFNRHSDLFLPILH